MNIPLLLNMKKIKKGAVNKEKNNSCLYSCYKIEKKIKKGLLKNKKTTAVYIAVIKQKKK